MLEDMSAQSGCGDRRDRYVRGTVADLRAIVCFPVLSHSRRQLLWFEVSRHPTAAWLARQITEAFPWASAPAYLVRDNDRAYGHVFTAMGIRDRPISPGSPWQNGIAERLIGTLRRECLDRLVEQVAPASASHSMRLVWG